MSRWAGWRAVTRQTLPQPTAPRPRPLRGMNRTEARYYTEVLLPRLHAGELVGIWYEGLRLRLAGGAYYKPDFLVQRADGTLELHEVKGFMREAAQVRLKVIAELYPFPIYVVRCLPRKQGGGWTLTLISHKD